MRWLLLVLALLWTMPGLAQQGETSTGGDILTGRFTQERFLQGFDNALRSEGNFLMAPGRGLIWRVERPFPMVTLIGPNGLVQQVNGRETMRLPAERVPLLGQLYALLGAALHGDWQQLARLDLEVRRSETNGGRWDVELAPRAGSGFETTGIRRIVAAGEQFVETLEMHKAGGDRDRLVFSAHRLSRAPLAAADAALLGQAAAQ